MFGSKKNKAKIISDKVVEKKFDFSSISIFTMPRRFKDKAASETNEGSHKTGLMILIFGTLLLVGGLFAVYYFLSLEPGKISLIGGTTKETAKEKIDEEELNIAEKETKNDISQKTIIKKEDSLSGGEIEEEDKDREKKNEVIDSRNSLDKKQDDLGLKEDELATSSNVIATSTEEQATSSAPIVFESELSLVDFDGDGIYDIEEMVLGTDKSKIDSDDDGYGDFSELYALYNPAGEGTLFENPRIEKYVNDFYGLEFLYPLDFEIKIVGEDGSAIIQINDNEFIQVLVEENKEGLSVLEWYRKQFQLDNISAANIIKKDNWSGVITDDASTKYLKDLNSDFILAISYVSLGDIHFPNIFEIMFESLVKY